MSTKNTLDSGSIFSALFCEDIRAEAAGSATLVGVYGTDLEVREFPFLLPKLAVFIRGMIPKEITNLDFKIRIEQGDEVLLEESIPYKNDSSTANKPELAGQDVRLHTSVDLRIHLAPIHIASPCTLRVVLEANNDQFTLTKLHVSPKS